MATIDIRSNIPPITSKRSSTQTAIPFQSNWLESGPHKTTVRKSKKWRIFCNKAQSTGKWHLQIQKSTWSLRIWRTLDLLILELLGRRWRKSYLTTHSNIALSIFPLAQIALETNTKRVIQHLIKKYRHQQRCPRIFWIKTWIMQKTLAIEFVLLIMIKPAPQATLPSGARKKKANGHPKITMAW